MPKTIYTENIIDLDSESSYPNVYYFFPKGFTDSKENFKKNLETQPSDWYYRNNTVIYTVNSQGYRCNDFKKIDWSNSVIMLGCSFVFGQGVTDVDCLPFQLQELLGINVVNLGVCGGSPQSTLYNLVVLNKHNIKPKAIINVWPSTTRILHIDQEMNSFHGGRWNNWGFPEHFDYSKYLIKFNTHKINFDFIFQISNMLYSNIPVFHFSMTEADHDKKIQFLPSIDYARDVQHPGRESHKHNAKTIYNLIKKHL